ncbi:MAG: OsmC family protein [candidate division Zixibacteria bacterium]|nr:OsmC family protein [candidate division Zixibacteria bacterium]
MKAKIRRIDGLALAGVSDSNHWVTMDGPAEFGGFLAGARPMELVLLGVASCAAMDVLSILRKKKTKLSDFAVEVDADRAKEHPQVFTAIRLHYILTGKRIRPADVERSIELTDEKYCGAIAMLKGNVAITHDYEIREPDL